MFKGSDHFNFFPEMSSLDIAMTLFGGPGRLSALGARLAPLLIFSDPATNRDRPAANRDRPAANRDCVRGESRFAAGRSRFVAGSENDKSGAKRAVKADSHPGPRNKAIALSKEDISEKMESGQTL